MDGKKEHTVYFLYGLNLFLLTIYSYSQIDLNLTLTGNTVYQYFQNKLIYLGYYNRPLSAVIYLAILIALFGFYLYIGLLSVKGSVKPRQLKPFIIMHIFFALLSYPAFSHDFFNYMFDARIVTKYFANPYITKALDFPYDPWIRFMHWTHRTYPYGPLWLALSIPFSFLGFGKFVLTMISFKLLFIAFHMGNVLMIYKIARRLISKNANIAAPVCFYALNPLIIIESLTSPHNEVVMLFFLLAGIYYLLVRNSRIPAAIFLLLSVAVKFITVVILPLFLLPSKFYTGKKPFIIKAAFILLLIPLFWEIRIREPYPWYFIPVLGIMSLLGISANSIILLSGLSMGLLLRYITFIYTGEYDAYTAVWQNIFLTGTFALSFVLVILNSYRMRKNN